MHKRRRCTYIPHSHPQLCYRKHAKAWYDLHITVDTPSIKATQPSASIVPYFRATDKLENEWKLLHLPAKGGRIDAK